jgi:hypothetical protein
VGGRPDKKDVRTDIFIQKRLLWHPCLGLLKATAGIGSGFFPCNILFSYESFEVTMRLIVSI